MCGITCDECTCTITVSYHVCCIYDMQPVSADLRYSADQYLTLCIVTNLCLLLDVTCLAKLTCLGW